MTTTDAPSPHTLTVATVAIVGWLLVHTVLAESLVASGWNHGTARALAGMLVNATLLAVLARVLGRSATLRRSTGLTGDVSFSAVTTGLQVGFIGAAANLVGILTVADAGLRYLHPTTVEGWTYTSSTSTELAMAVLWAVVSAPVAEELLFRGLLFGGLRPVMGPWPAMVLVSIVFAVLHPHGVASASFWLVTALALLWNLAREWTSSVAASVTAHVALNGALVLGSWRSGALVRWVGWYGLALGLTMATLVSGLLACKATKPRPPFSVRRLLVVVLAGITVFAYVMPSSLVESSPTLIVLRAAALRHRLRYDEAERLLERAARTFPTSPDVILERALVLYVTGRYAEAMAAVAPLAAGPPFFAAAYHDILASCLADGGGSLDEARRHARAAVAATPPDADHRAAVLETLGWVLTCHKDLAAAERVMVEASSCSGVTTADGLVERSYHRAMLHLAQGRRAMALAELRGVAQGDDRLPWVRRARDVLQRLP